MPENSTLLWENAAWQKQAHVWIREMASQKGIQLMGEIRQPHIRHWSTVMEVDSDGGKIFFKATASETIYEIALTEKLAMWQPDDMPDLIAVDATCGWLLLRDGGKQLRASIRPTKDIRPWEPVIRRYAELQIELVQHVDQMLTVGIPDRRLNVLPALLVDLLSDEKSILLGQEKGLSAEEYQQCLDYKPRFKEICSELDAIGIPASINHGDFHDANILVKDGCITFFDWGDADITHPFVSLRTFFVSIEMSLELDDYEFTPEMAALLDIYQKPFEAYASKDNLLKAFELSKPVSSLITALKWRESIARMTESMRAENKWIVPEVLREFLHHMSAFDGQV